MKMCNDLHQVQDENWSTFTMGLEFAWWLSEIAPVALNLSGLHVLSCARVLGCRCGVRGKLAGRCMCCDTV